MGPSGSHKPSLFQLTWTLWGLFHRLTSVFFPFFVSTSLCFYALNLLLLFPKTSKSYQKTERRAGALLWQSLSLVIWKKTNSLKRPNSNLAIKASGTQLSSSTLPHRVEGEEREEGCPCWNIPDLMLAVLRITMDFLFCFWPRTQNTLLTLGVLPCYHWDPCDIKYLVMTIKKEWRKQHSSNDIKRVSKRNS